MRNFRSTAAWMLPPSPKGEGPHSSNPLGCASADCLVLLVALTLDRDTAARLLEEISGEMNADALRISVLCRRLVRRARREVRSGAVLDKALGERLQCQALSFKEYSLFDLATLWSQARDGMDGLSAAALLWTIARTQAPCYRRLEQVVVEDLTWFGAKELLRRAPAI